MSTPADDQDLARIPVVLSMEDPDPMYRQIEVQIRDFIVSGQLVAGTKLPSVRALAHDLSCSVITTRRAYQDLENGGFIRSRQGMGTVVAELGEDQRASRRREPVLESLAEASRTARKSGFSEEELREMFEEVLGEDRAADAGNRNAI